MNAENVNAPTPPVGVIESLSQGFETVAEHLLLLLLPLLLDLFLWLGPRIDFGPAIDAFLDVYHDQLWVPFVAQAGSGVEQDWNAIAEALTVGLGDKGAQYLPVPGVPILLAGRKSDSLPFGYTPQVFEINTPGDMLGVRILSLVGGLVLGTTYISLIAHQVRDGHIALKRVITRLPGNILEVGILSILVPILVILIYLPFGVLALGFSTFSQKLAVLTNWAGWLLVIWIVLFLVFTVHGLLMNNRGLLGALWDSIRVVQWNITATMGLVLLVVLINVALTAIWSMAPVGSWLTVAAIVGNAFISTGLLAATFVFFRDRYRYWREMRAQLLVELERRRAGHSRR